MANSTVGPLVGCKQISRPVCWPAECRGVSCVISIGRWYPSPWPTRGSPVLFSCALPLSQLACVCGPHAKLRCFLHQLSSTIIRHSGYDSLDRQDIPLPLIPHLGHNAIQMAMKRERSDIAMRSNDRANVLTKRSGIVNLAPNCAATSFHSAHSETCSLCLATGSM